jgi:hypothetical protein
LNVTKRMRAAMGILGWAAVSALAYGCAASGRSGGEGIDEPADGGPQVVVDSARADARVDAPDGPVDVPDASPPRCDPSKPFLPPTTVASLNQPGSLNVDARLGRDELSAFFRSERSASASGDIWYATRASPTAPFGSPTQVSGVNGAGYDFSPAPSADLLAMFFVRGALYPGQPRIFVSTRTATTSPFGAPSEVPGLYGDNIDTFPHLPPAGQRLYFRSSRSSFAAPGLATATITPAGAATAITELTELNAGGTSNTPVVADDERTIYFSTERAGGAGGQDIWMAERSSVGAPFGPPTTVPELNTANADYPTWVSADKCILYLSSDRSGVYAIYEAVRPR